MQAAAPIESLMGSMLLIIGLGIAIRHFRPMSIDPDLLRQQIATLVYTLLLPALVISVIWRAELTLSSIAISISAGATVLFSLALAATLYRLLPVKSDARGAMMLAAAFPNATYLGLPLLTALFGSRGSEIAIQFDLFACTPLLLTLGPLIGQRMGAGGSGSGQSILQTMVRIPPLWAALVAILLNQLLPPQVEVINALEMLGRSVVPLMLVTIGLSLRFDQIRPRRVAETAPALLISLLLAPLFTLLFTGWLFALDANLNSAIIIEAAMPVMLLGIVICDRYRLDSALYAVAATLSTLLSFITIPFWISLLNQ